MPPKDGLRLNDLRRSEQARPAPGHPDQQGPVTAAQPTKTRRRTPQGDAELMAEEQVPDDLPDAAFNDPSTREGMGRLVACAVDGMGRAAPVTPAGRFSITTSWHPDL
jgi:hypothetical protein